MSTALAIFAVLQGPLTTPYASRAPLQIELLQAPGPTAQYAVAEYRFKIGGTFDNPFDPREVSLDAEITSPSGKSHTMPGFFARDYTRRLDGTREVLEPSGETHWRVRICPREAGTYTVQVRARDRSGMESKIERLQCTTSNHGGIVGVSSRDRRYFETDRGKPYYPLGANVAWAGARGTYDYDTWLEAYSQAGANYARLWLSPDWTTFALERAGKPEEGRGMGQFDLGNAWRLDYVLGLASRHGLRLQLCIDSYNILRNVDASNFWERTPHNADNGGPLRVWTDFWTDGEMERLYRAKLRYLVARWAAHPEVFAWEFWNEVDLTRGYEPSTVAAWHGRMAAELKKLDPYDHPLTTSLASTMGDRTLDLHRGLDFFQTHHYGSDDPAVTVAQQQSRKGAWGRPHFFGEIGADASGPRADLDPNGLQVHDPIWISFATGASGSAMPWWWDSLIAPRDLYRHFAAAAKFIRGVEWPREAFRQTNVTLAYANPRAPRPRKDLVMANGPVTWAPSVANRPTRVTVTGTGSRAHGRLAGIQHGIRNHPALHNPVLFEVNLPRPTRFEVEVGDVSGFGGAALRIKIDGRPVLNRTFADQDGTEKTDNLKQYAGVYGLTLPRGRHTVTVENVGPDWFMASYRFADLLPRRTPPMDAWAIMGNDVSVGWLRAEGRDWKSVALLKRKAKPVPASYVSLAGLASGNWRVEIWDTWKGQIIQTQAARVTNAGRIRFSIPAFEGDLAFKLIKEVRRTSDG